MRLEDMLPIKEVRKKYSEFDVSPKGSDNNVIG
jgi:hypothetical protein